VSSRTLAHRWVLLLDGVARVPKRRAPEALPAAARGRASSASPPRQAPAAGRVPTAEPVRYLTTKDVSNAPAPPQEMTIGHRPRVVFVPTIHVHETRPCTERFEYSPDACDEPDMYITMILHVDGCETAAVNVA
jgi:hypothetical protein